MSSVSFVQLSTPVRGDADWLRDKLAKMFGDVSIEKRASISTFKISTDDHVKKRVIDSGKLDDYLCHPMLDINTDEKPHTSADYLLSGILGFYPPPFQPLVEHKELEMSEIEFKYLKRLYSTVNIKLNLGDVDSMLSGLLDRGIVEIFRKNNDEFVRFKENMRKAFYPYARFTKLFKLENYSRPFRINEHSDKFIALCEDVVGELSHSDFSIDQPLNGPTIDRNGSRIIRIRLGEDYGDIIINTDCNISLRAGWDRTFVVDYDKSVKLTDFLNECFRTVE